MFAQVAGQDGEREKILILVPQRPPRGLSAPCTQVEKKAQLEVLTCVRKLLVDSIIFSRPKMLSKAFPYTSPRKNGQRWETGRKFVIGM